MNLALTDVSNGWASRHTASRVVVDSIALQAVTIAGRDMATVEAGSQAQEILRVSHNWKVGSCDGRMVCGTEDIHHNGGHNVLLDCTCPRLDPYPLCEIVDSLCLGNVFAEDHGCCGVQHCQNPDANLRGFRVLNAEHVASVTSAVENLGATSKPDRESVLVEYPDSTPRPSHHAYPCPTPVDDRAEVAVSESISAGPHALAKAADDSDNTLPHPSCDASPA